MNDLASAILAFFADGTDLSELLGAFALVGLATSAIIQAVKDIFPARRWFQAWRFNAWLEERCASEDDRRQAAASIFALAVDGDRKALLTLPSEELASHLNAALRAAVENPRLHLALFQLGARQAAPEDRELLLREWTDPPADDMIARLAEARSRVWYHMQRAVAGFELKTGYRWKWWIQACAFILSALLTVLAMRREGLSLGGRSLWHVVLAAVLAGFLAPVARDITVVLARLREGKV